MSRFFLAAVLFGCSRGPVVLGEQEGVEALEEVAQDLDDALRSTTQGAVILRGRIGQVCKEGCWFYLLGESGVLYVKLDLTEGLVLPPESEGKDAMVRGVLQTVDGAQSLVGETVVLY